MIKSKVISPTYCGLLSVNIILFLCIATNHCQIFFVAYSLVLMSMLKSLFSCLQFLHQFCFFSFPLFCQRHHCSIICTTLFHFCLHFFLVSVIFCVLNSTYGFSSCDLLDSNTRCILFSFNPSLR